MSTDYHHPDYEEWVIRACDCGFPLGATLAAIQLVRCPDCNRMTTPVEDVTRRVHVVNVEKPDVRCGHLRVTDEMVYRALAALHPNPDPLEWAGVDVARAAERMRVALEAALDGALADAR